MKPALPFIFLTSLLLPAISVANTDVKTAPEPATNLNQPDTVQPTAAEKNQITPTASNGQLLYENHCLKCHESNVHIRENNKAKNIDDLRAWVIKWQAYEKLGWDNNAINAVTEYLLGKYYKFK